MQRKKTLWRVVFVLSLVSLLAMAGIYTFQVLAVRREAALYEGLRQYAPPRGFALFGSARADELPSLDLPADSAPDALTEVDFESLAQINPDVIGWIRLDDSPIDYPIVKSEDDQFYLTHTFTGESGDSGAIFLGRLYTPDFSEGNSVIYGHHMKDGSMFRNLVLYKDEAYFNENQGGTLFTPLGDYDLEIFSAYIARDGHFQRSGFEGEDDTNAFFDEIVARSMHEAPFTPRFPDQVLTLVTCSYEYNDVRYVVHARMVPRTDLQAAQILGQ